MCQKWFAKFCAGDFSLDDDVPQSGRPAEVDRDQIKTLIENNQCYTMQERAHILKIPKSIKLLIKIKNVFVILQKKLNGFFGQLNILGVQSTCLCGLFVTLIVYLFLLFYGHIYKFNF